MDSVRVEIVIDVARPDACVTVDRRTQWHKVLHDVCVELATLFLVLSCVELHLFEELSVVRYIPRMDSFTAEPPTSELSIHTF